jgi:hypothetical protein
MNFTCCERYEDFQTSMKKEHVVEESSSYEIENDDIELMRNSLILFKVPEGVTRKDKGSWEGSLHNSR